jgi:hypothetical protein
MTDALNRAIRNSFLGTADGLLRLETTALVEESHGRRLHFTGFHRDGTPFAVESALFTTSPLARAAQIAQDIITTHTGVQFMPAPVAIAGLAQTLRERLTAVTERAGALSARAGSTVENFNAVLDSAESVLKEVDGAAAEVQAALGLSTNGGPTPL